MQLLGSKGILDQCFSGISEPRLAVHCNWACVREKNDVKMSSLSERRMCQARENNQDRYLKAETTIILIHVCAYTCTLNININVVSNHGLKLKSQNYTPKGTGAHAVEKRGLSGLDACLCVLQSCSAPSRQRYGQPLVTSCCQKSEGGQNLVC